MPFTTARSKAQNAECRHAGCVSAATCLPGLAASGSAIRFAAFWNYSPLRDLRRRSSVTAGFPLYRKPSRSLATLAAAMRSRCVVLRASRTQHGRRQDLMPCRTASIERTCLRAQGLDSRQRLRSVSSPSPQSVFFGRVASQDSGVETAAVREVEVLLLVLTPSDQHPLTVVPPRSLLRDTLRDTLRPW